MKYLVKSLGIHGPTGSKKWIPGSAKAWLKLHKCDNAGDAVFHYKVYDEAHKWAHGKVPEVMPWQYDMLAETKALGFKNIVSYIPFTNDNPQKELNNTERASLSKAAKAFSDEFAVYTHIFTFGNYRPSNWLSSFNSFLSAEKIAVDVWHESSKLTMPSSDCGPVFDASHAIEREIFRGGEITHIGTHDYGDSGFSTRSLSLFNDAIHYQLKHPVTVIYLEAHKGFPGKDSTRGDRYDLFTAETGAYLLELKTEADKLKVEMAWFTIDMFFDEDLNPNDAGLALSGRIDANAWSPETDRKSLYRLLRLSGESHFSAIFKSMIL